MNEINENTYQAGENVPILMFISKVASFSDFDTSLASIDNGV
jgi:hypothetical protein